MLTYVLGIGLLLAVATVILRVTTGEDRYARMSEEEFEAEAKRTSMTAAGMLAVQSIVDPNHRAEYLLQQDKHVEAEGEELGDRPPGHPPDAER